jgi:hypothetical protein
MPAAGKASRKSAVVERPMTIDQAFEFARNGYLWAVIDSCDTPEVPRRLRQLDRGQAVCLLQEDYWAIAPYLVRLDGALLEWLEESFWETPWGVLALSKEPIESLHAHFRGLLNQTLADGKQWYFRYYDPRVIEKYMHQHDRQKTSALFGPVRCFGITSGKDSGWRGFLLD